MKYSVLWRPEVENDLCEGAEWYDKQHAGLGDEFLAEIRNFISQLPALPILPRIRHAKSQIRWVYPPRFPYRIYFRVIKTEFVIYAVIHTARTEGDWTKRLEQSAD